MATIKDQAKENQPSRSVSVENQGAVEAPDAVAGLLPCPNCAGRGSVRLGRGYFRVTEGCEDCGGTGRVSASKAAEIYHEDSYWDDPLRATNKC
jgi:DnaJ-class molecular chaperone